MKTLLLLAGALLLLPFSSCRRTVSSFRVEPPGARETTKDATEWITRLEEHWRPDLSDLYAELPPLEQWPAITERLKTPRPSDDAKDQKKLFLLGQLLEAEPDHEAINVTLRELIVLRRERLEQSHSRERAFSYLYTFSPSAADSRKWAGENIPEATEAENPYGSYEYPESIKLLQKNKIDEAIELLWKEAKHGDDSGEKLSALGQLIQLGKLLDRPELLADARKAAISGALSFSTDNIYGTYSLTPLFRELIERNDWSTIKKISDRLRKRKGFTSTEFHSLGLLATYRLSGSDAFMKELATSSDYGVEDAGKYADLIMDTIDGSLTSIGELLVRAFHEKGEKEKAFDTLRHLIAGNSGNDRLYRLSIELFPDTSADFFRALLTYDPYQERPLIWLAEMELGKGNLAEARKLIDQAIALDPSDGEQGKDTRMQVYDVLSRILLAEGDKEKAGFFAGVMKAIREGEKADDYLAAGLVTEAVRRYQEALGHFQDAYCLQSRLALTLMRNGKFDEAAKHFEKAFELMPVSFGPVESHCFGCEGIFEDDKVRAIALGVFRKFIEKSPENPRTYYLMGMLLEKADDKKEAAVSYKRALELDPKYYNCAVHLYALLKSEPATMRDAALFFPKLVAIAPYPKLALHFQSRTDLRQAWIDAQDPPPSPLSLPPLPLAFQPEKKENNPVTYRSGRLTERQAIDGWTPDELLRDNDLVEWIDNGY